MRARQGEGMKATPMILTVSALVFAASATAQTVRPNTTKTAQVRTTQVRTVKAPVRPATRSSVQARLNQTRVTISPTSGNLELGLTGGYAGGGNVGVFVGYKNLAGPIGARIGLSRSRNNNGFNDDRDLSGGVLGTVGQNKANGNITGEAATAQTVSLDATYDLGQPLPGLETGIYAGLRYGAFNSRLTFRGGQYTDYSSSAFGVGVGSQAGYLITNNISVVGDLGVDQYFPGNTINTRDSQGNTDSFQKGQGGYDSVNAAVRRPGTVLKASLGLKYKF
jgi:hypothetical protein